MWKCPHCSNRIDHLNYSVTVEQREYGTVAIGVITFDDGTTATISSLASAAIPTISAMFTSLHQANFATAIVDWIAWEVYYTKP